MSDSLTLKWGTLKGWEFHDNKPAQEILSKYIDLGASASAAMQRDTSEQKQLLVDLINSCNGEIWNDWDGEMMTKDQAINYVMTYGQ